MTLHEQTSQQNRSETGAQPSSRRALRESERRAAAGDTGQVDPTEHPSGVYDLNQSGSYDIWDTISRRAASQLTEAAAEAERRTGRRVAPGNSGAMAAGHSTGARPMKGSPSIATPDGSGLKAVS